VCLDLFSTLVLTLQVYQTARIQEHYGVGAANRFMTGTAGLRTAAVWSFLLSTPAILLLLLIAAVAMLPEGDPGICIPLVVIPSTATAVLYAIWEYAKQYKITIKVAEETGERHVTDQKGLLADALTPASKQTGAGGLPASGRPNMHVLFASSARARKLISLNPTPLRAF